MSEDPNSKIRTSQTQFFKSVCKTCSDEDLQNSNLTQIIEAIDEYLRGEKESNDKTNSKFSDQEGWKLSEGFRKNFISAGKEIQKFCEEHTTTVVNVFNIVGRSHWTAVGLVLVASALDRLETVKKNQKECLMLLKSMNDLAKIVLELEALPHETLNTQAKMKEAINMIIEGAIMCTKVMQAKKIKGMIHARDYKTKLLYIRREIKEMRSTLHAHISVCMFKWVCENAKRSPEKNYTSPNTRDADVIDDKSPGNDKTRDVSKKRGCDPPQTPSPSKRAKIGDTTTDNKSNTKSSK